MRIDVVLFEDRTLPGELQVLDESDTVIYGPVKCLGKADNNDAKLHGNPSRDSLKPFGDTPTGKHRIARLVTHSPGETEVHTYGTYPSILLDPSSGNALLAKKNGRSGLMIHGGAPGTGVRLRPTHGCIRVSEESQRDLAALVVHATLASSSVSVTERIDPT